MSCRFCDFISGKKKTHRNQYRFIPLFTTRYSVSFLSIDHPMKEQEHILVIPKKHYEFIEDVPKATSNDLMNHVQKAVRVLRKTHKGCNILLNDGKAAGQYVHHTHFHVVPRDPHDDIQIELWKQVNISKKAFEELSDHLQKEFKKC